MLYIYAYIVVVVVVVVVVRLTVPSRNYHPAHQIAAAQNNKVKNLVRTYVCTLCSEPSLASEREACSACMQPSNWYQRLGIASFFLIKDYLRAL